MIIKTHTRYINLNQYKKFYFDLFNIPKQGFVDLEIILTSNTREDEYREEEEVVDYTDDVFSDYLEELAKTGVEDCNKILEHHLKAGLDFCDLPEELEDMYKKRKNPQLIDY